MTCGEFESIRIVDVRRRSGDFHTTIRASLNLLKDTDPRRFNRVTKNLDWIVNTSLSSPGAEYWHWARACAVNFEESWPGRDVEFSIAFHAGLLVHEATHAYLECRGIRYDEDNRMRIEALCVEEQNRWAAGLDNQELGKMLTQDFDAQDWDFCWNGSKLDHFKAVMRNSIRTKEAEQGRDGDAEEAV
jgi:hypothetical protein